MRHARAVQQPATAITVKFGEGHDDGMQRKMPSNRLDKPRLTRAVTSNRALDETSRSKTATLDTNTPLEQQQEHESSSLTVLVQKGTFTPIDERTPGEISVSRGTDNLPESLHENKGHSRSKTKKRRNSRENERKTLLRCTPVSRRIDTDFIL
jgi:hypothetical protein